MKLAFQLAYRNLMGAGLRTWLNVAVLSFAFVVMLFFNSLLSGWNEQAKKDSIDWQYGYGQLLHENYDPIDPFTIQDGHGELKADPNYARVLIQQASIYPQGRMQAIALKGIDANQDVVKLPTQSFGIDTTFIPAIIGEGMSQSTKLNIGDEVLMRWRDKNGTFDAATIKIVATFSSTVPSVDKGQIWIPIEKLWDMTGLQNHASIAVVKEGFEVKKTENFRFESQKSLLAELQELIDMKKSSSSFMYILLLGVALLAIFDTQVLSIFRRQKEIGTYIAMGMTRQRVVGLFTAEGSMYSIFAMIVGLLYGTPLFYFLAQKGIGIPAGSQDMGVPIADRIYPLFGISLVLVTILIVFITATFVSYLPARKIAKMNPVEALKGKLQ